MLARLLVFPQLSGNDSSWRSFRARPAGESGQILWYPPAFHALLLLKKLFPWVRYCTSTCVQPLQTMLPSIPELLRTAICAQNNNSTGNFIEVRHFTPLMHASNPTHVPRSFSTLAKQDCRPRIICSSLNNAMVESFKILIGKIDDARQKVKWREDENLLGFCRRHPHAILHVLPFERQEIWNRIERYVGHYRLIIRWSERLVGSMENYNIACS